MKNIVYLDITSWQGMSIGAEHFYGALIHSGDTYQKIEVEGKMTSKQAKALSKKDDFPYRAGSRTTRFETREEVIEAAKIVFAEKFPGIEFLVVGNAAACDPKLVVVGPEEKKEKANLIFEEYKKIPWIHKYGFLKMSPDDEIKSYELFEQWESILKGA